MASRFETNGAPLRRCERRDLATRGESLEKCDTATLFRPSISVFYFCASIFVLTHRYSDTLMELTDVDLLGDGHDNEHNFK
jgi:hypothetical protein